MEGHLVLVYSFHAPLIAILLLFLVSFLTAFCLHCRRYKASRHHARVGHEFYSKNFEYTDSQEECKDETITQVTSDEAVASISRESVIPLLAIGNPGKPRATTSSRISFDSIELEWQKPEQGAHNVTSYIVYGTTSSDPNQWIKRSSITVTSDNPTCEKVLVTQLLERTTYYFKVHPECAAGNMLDSEISEPIKTKGIIPSQPGKPVGTSLSHDSIQLEWTIPEQDACNNITIAFYTIFYYSTNDLPGTWREQKTKAAEKKATVTGLSEKTAYLFKVRPEIEGDKEIGLVSDESEPIQTAMMIPSKPGKPKAVSVTHNSIKLEWKKPEQGAHNVIAYHIFYHSHEDPPDKWREHKPECAKESVIVSQLSERTLYSFKVRLKSKTGSVIESDISRPITTRESLTYKNIYRKLQGIGEKWYDLGAVLGLDSHKLDSIKHKNKDEWESCLKDMINQWLREIGGTWEKLISALKDDIDQLYPLANSIAKSLSTDSSEGENEESEAKDDIPSGVGYKCLKCGESSIDHYLKGECPRSSSDLDFPYLCTKNLTKNGKEKLYAHLKHQTEEIITEFSKLIDHVRHSFKQQDIDAKEVAASIISISRRQSLTHPLVHSLDVKMVNSVTVVISDLERQNYISFINYHIVQYLVEQYGTDEDKTKLRAYEVKFKEYGKRNVFEVPQAVFGSPPDDGKMLAFKVTENITENLPCSCNHESSIDFPTAKKSARTLQLSLNDARTIQQIIATELGIENIGNLVFLGANVGCIELKFSVPNTLLDTREYNVKTLTDLPGFAALETKGISILCGPPGKPYAIAVTTNSVKLQWSKPEYHGSHSIQYYHVLYKSLNESSAKWRVGNLKHLRRL